MRRLTPIPGARCTSDDARKVAEAPVGNQVWTFVAALAAVLSAIQLVPQAWNAIKARDLATISLPSFLLISLTTSLWAAYGAHLADLAIIFANSLALLCALTVSLMKVRKG